MSGINSKIPEFSSSVPMCVNREEKLNLLENWKSSHDQLQEQFDAIGKCFDSVTGPLFEASWRVFGGYTAALSVIIGDNLNALEWYQYECEMGLNPKQGGNDGDMRSIATFDDLLWLIDEENKVKT